MLFEFSNCTAVVGNQPLGYSCRCLRQSTSA